ncbi:disease resistance protein RUN1-like [Malus sylvestris]|uniref:disease resistance protein RUN1-like n=1 Tax=Malus sylvestris TaxID=3752 RepID=UPI0021AD1C5B|nr:disease resistance protein RUN1-like [Malus sylvestris]
MPNCQLMKMASSSSSSKCSKYDVFLSFRGETRKSLTDNLYCTLKDHRFNVFIDENELTRGEIITPALKQAVKDSRLAAIIFSSGYAESRWCLDELVEILASRRTMGQMVLPIFYNIDPSDVRHQRGAFAEAFRRHQECFPKMVQTWKDALKEAAELAGEDFSVTDGYKGRFVRKIVDEITRKLKNTNLAVAPNPVGIDSRVQEIGNHLDVEGSYDVRIIGIWGMGGLGKTTVAKAIFNKYQGMFQCASFIPNVREDKTLVDSQNTLLSDVLRSGNIKVSRADEGTEDIKRRLGNLKVLVIIDDVDSVDQLDALGIERDSFGPRSRIVITTRNEHLLEALKPDKICHLPAMNKEESLELLSWRAFSKNYPNEEYVQVSREVVEYCGGLPLALQDLGTYLRAKSTSEWKSALGKWKRSRPYPAVHKRLKISYDGLTDDDVKSMFLDISCFFIGMNKDYVMKILDQHDCNTIRELHDQCLVTVDTEGNLMMHGLIRDTGREIVREKSPDILGKRCRLWDHEDVKRVLRTKTGREEVQGLSLDLSERHKPSFSTEAFREMHGLRLLKLKGVQFTGHCEDLSEHLSKELRWLCWLEFPMKGIPRDFNQTNLVDIDLSHSNIQVWEDSNVTLEKLKFLNLGYCNCLIRLPDFSKIPNLERLILKDCKNLQAIPALPKNLEILEADECIALEKMPNFSEMSRMRELHLNHSPKLSDILGLDKALNSMTRVHMEGCTNLTAAFKEAILQEWSASGNGGLFLPGNEIPSWFTPIDPQGEIVVPQSFGDLKALTVCIIYSSDDSQSGGSLCIRVANCTQNTEFLISPMRATAITSHENYLWLGHLSNYKLNVKGGDKINVGARFVGPAATDDIHLRVKKIGINLEKEKLINEYALECQSMPYSSECNEDGNHKAARSDDSSHENQSRKRLRSDPSVERKAEEETDEIMQEGSSMG